MDPLDFVTVPPPPTNPFICIIFYIVFCMPRKYRWGEIVMQLIPDWEFAGVVQLENEGSKELKVMNENSFS